MTDSPPEDTPNSPRYSALGLVAASAWVGLVAGLCESAMAAAMRATGTVAMEDLRVNRHFVGMIPASDLILFVAIGLILACANRVAPRLVRRIAGPILAFVAFSALLIRVPSLSRYACWTLAAGLGIQAGRMAIKNTSRMRTTIRWTLAPLAAVVATLFVAEVVRVGGSESRAMATLPAPRRGAPNVLLLVMDTVRADHLSLHGYPRDTSPNLAKLAESGVRFDRAISPSPWTLPSHASMFTGRWPFELSAGAASALDRNYATLAEFLASRGYATGGFAANTFYCNAAYGLDRGFARYEDFPENVEVSAREVFRSSSLGRQLMLWTGLGGEARAGEEPSRKSAARINADLLRWVDGKPGRPFFAFANYYDAHGPYDPPEGHVRRFGLSRLPRDERDDLLFQRVRLARGQGPSDGRDPKALLARITDFLRDTYDDCVASLDGEIGLLFDDLRSRHLLDNTIVIVTSDHGEEFGDHSLFGHGVSLYEPEVHVPLIVLGPGVPKGRSVGEAVSLRDLPATVAGLLGHAADSPFPGRSVLANLDARGPSDPVLTEVEHQKKFAPSPLIPASRGPVRGLVRGRFTYFLHADGSEELYDVQADPRQANNLAARGDTRADLERLRDAMADVSSRPDPTRVARGAARRSVVR